jgi:hypothetical protein
LPAPPPPTLARGYEVNSSIVERQLYVYLDESGDLGFGQRSTKYFTIAFAIVEDLIPFRRCVKKVKMKYDIPRDATPIRT